MSEVQAVAEKLVTFGQLLKIKREARGLSLGEVVRQTKITMLSHYEKDKCFPRKGMLSKLIAFYKLTETEMNNCREVNESATISASLAFKPTHGKRITVLLESLAHVIQDVTAMPSQGLLATRLRLDCLDNLDKAQMLLQDAVIIERLI